ncbi:hypothetical protein GCM10010960_01830 [Arenimonas maotaiensis]|uniref:HNH endonuclease n=1 Tax=Arenimonas maotaiensis TaxID=1446479 RepID=A0A917CBP4_9GAMM|nr:hypothetical protein [Arenimonas maotaiensis]GGF83390.1 hypothetical protein GCM10010960_01830 [Arenimonas maotaiensis]
MSHFLIKKAAYSAIEERYRCTHEVREIRLRILVDSRKAYYNQCISCGHAGSAIGLKSIKNQAKPISITLFDNELEIKWRARKNAEYQAIYIAIEPSLKAEYEAYLESETWRKRRMVILERATKKCECCEHYPATEIHHKTYARIGQELDSDLMAVCKLCHDQIHGKFNPSK